MAGASGYLLKRIRGTSLVDAIRQVAAGKSCWLGRSPNSCWTRCGKNATGRPARIVDRARTRDTCADRGRAHESAFPVIEPASSQPAAEVKPDRRPCELGLAQAAAR